MCGEVQVDRIDTRQALAFRHRLAGIDEAFEQFAGNAKSQVALHTGSDHAGKRACSGIGVVHERSAHEQCLRTRVGGWLGGAGAQQQRRQSDERDCRGVVEEARSVSG